MLSFLISDISILITRPKKCFQIPMMDFSLDETPPVFVQLPTKGKKQDGVLQRHVLITTLTSLKKWTGYITTSHTQDKRFRTKPGPKLPNLATRRIQAQG